MLPLQERPEIREHLLIDRIFMNTGIMIII
jgi:hypothetical protein